MDLSPHNIQRITEWIQSEVDYNFLNPGYTITFNDDQILLEQNDKELKQVCPHCLVVPRYPLFFKYGHLTCLSYLREYRRYRFMFEKMLLCPICKQSCHLNEIYSYQVEKNKRPNSISMRMFQRVKFICSYAGCGKSYPLENIHHHEMLNVLIEVSYVLHKVVNLLKMWRLYLFIQSISLFICCITQYVNHCTMCQFLLMIAM